MERELHVKMLIGQLRAQDKALEPYHISIMCIHSDKDENWWKGMKGIIIILLINHLKSYLTSDAK